LGKRGKRTSGRGVQGKKGGVFWVKGPEKSDSPKKNPEKKKKKKKKWRHKKKKPAKGARGQWEGGHADMAGGFSVHNGNTQGGKIVLRGVNLKKPLTWFQQRLSQGQSVNGTTFRGGDGNLGGVLSACTIGLPFRRWGAKENL